MIPLVRYWIIGTDEDGHHASSHPAGPTTIAPPASERVAQIITATAREILEAHKGEAA
jgi:hypothetical protein